MATEHQEKIKVVEDALGIKLCQEIFLVDTWKSYDYKESKYKYHGLISTDKVRRIGISTRGIRVGLNNHNKFGKDFKLGERIFFSREEAENKLKEWESRN